jgi:hypothetical protein
MKIAKKGRRPKIDFDLTEEQRMLKDMAYKFAVTEFTPVSHECDKVDDDINPFAL